MSQLRPAVCLLNLYSCFVSITCNLEGCHESHYPFRSNNTRNILNLTSLGEENVIQRSYQIIMPKFIKDKVLMNRCTFNIYSKDISLILSCECNTKINTTDITHELLKEGNNFQLVCVTDGFMGGSKVIKILHRAKVSEELLFANINWLMRTTTKDMDHRYVIRATMPFIC